MTNKPMLSVEREVIEKALRDALTIRFDTDSHVTKLRSLLDQPACTTPSGKTCPGDGVGACKKCPTALPQGESAACNHEWTDDGEFLLVCTACGTQEDYTQALQLAFELGGTDDGSYHLEAEELCEVIRRYVEQPAPVAVDTERLDFILCKSRTVTTEILPDGYALYVEEGLMGDKVYPQVKASIVGKENRKSLQRQAIDLAITEVARLNGEKP